MPMRILPKFCARGWSQISNIICLEPNPSGKLAIIETRPECQPEFSSRQSNVVNVHPNCVKCVQFSYKLRTNIVHTSCTLRTLFVYTSYIFRTIRIIFVQLSIIVICPGKKRLRHDSGATQTCFC